MASEERLIDAYQFRGKHEVAEVNGKLNSVILYGDIVNAPTVDAVEVVHGRWIDVALRYTQVKEKCSVCGGIVYAHGYNYCPNCGAKMDGDGNE